MKVRVERLREKQIEAAAELLTRAFHDQPHGGFWEPDPERRTRLLRERFLRSVRYSLARGEPYVAEDAGLAGVALWMPPQATWRTPEEEREYGFDQLPAIFGSKAFARYRRLGELLAGLHERDMKEAHWYLPTLGVEPTRQGTGVGGALLRQGCARADEERLPCYLDTAQPRNVPFYERHGFKILAHGLEPVSKVPYWTFRRDPASAHSTADCATARSAWTWGAFVMILRGVDHSRVAEAEVHTSNWAWDMGSRFVDTVWTQNENGRPIRSAIVKTT